MTAPTQCRVYTRPRTEPSRSRRSIVVACFGRGVKAFRTAALSDRLQTFQGLTLSSWLRMSFTGLLELSSLLVSSSPRRMTSGLILIAGHRLRHCRHSRGKLLLRPWLVLSWAQPQRIHHVHLTTNHIRLSSPLPLCLSHGCRHHSNVTSYSSYIPISVSNTDTSRCDLCRYRISVRRCVRLAVRVVIKPHALVGVDYRRDRPAYLAPIARFAAAIASF